MKMNNAYEIFQKLTAEEKRKVHIYLCERALVKWDEYVFLKGEIKYTESVTGTKQVVDRNLPSDALESVKQNLDTSNVEKRYLEPIVSLQDEDLNFPEQILFTYYSIYNVFRKYICGDSIDDWLIVNQALSAENSLHRADEVLLAAINSLK